MAGHGKPKAQEAKPAAPPVVIKPSRPKPDKTLTLDEATARLEALDFSGLTEEDRIGAVLEIRARLKEQEIQPEAPAKALARRVLLLRLWHELVQLRVIDVKNDRKPPFEKLETERLFPPVEGSDAADTPDDHDVQPVMLEEALKPLDPKPFVPPKDDEAELLISVKLLETEMVRGMKLPAGIVVDVQPEDADHLIEKGKAIRV